MLVFKHEGLLAFVGRLIHDREFCEWFVVQPRRALASHGLDVRDLEDLATVLRTDRQQREVSAALQPMIEVLMHVVDEAEGGVAISRPEERLERLDTELHSVRERLADVRAQQPRPWWKFWS